MMACANQAETMSLYEYEQRLWHWNEAHKSADDIDPPDAETTRQLIALAKKDPRLTMKAVAANSTRPL